MYQLGQRSKAELHGVDNRMSKVCYTGIKLTTQDFSIHDGLRKYAEQKEYVRTGVSKTMKSYHLPQEHDQLGKAVDLVPYINGKLRWEWPAIYKIAQAIHEAANKENVLLRWGAVWDSVFNELDASDLEGEVAAYVARRKNLGLKAFLDGPHFEIYDEFHHKWKKLRLHPS